MNGRFAKSPLGIFFFLVLGLFPIQIFADTPHSTLSWTRPSHFENNERLFVRKHIKEYRLYYATSKENIKNQYISIAPTKSYYSLGDIKKQLKNSKIIYLAMSTMSKQGIESELSEVIFYLP